MFLSRTSSELLFGLFPEPARKCWRPSKPRILRSGGNYPRESDSKSSTHQKCDVREVENVVFGPVAGKVLSPFEWVMRNRRNRSIIIPGNVLVGQKLAVGRKKKESCKKYKQERGLDALDRRFNSPIDIWSDFFDIQLLGTSSQEVFVVGDVEEIDLQVQVDGWSLPQLENFAIVAEQEFLRKRYLRGDDWPGLASTHATHPFEDEIVGLKDDDGNGEADQRQAGRK